MDYYYTFTVQVFSIKKITVMYNFGFYCLLFWDIYNKLMWGQELKFKLDLNIF